MLQLKDNNLIAYFSMEIGIDPEIPTYAGGLGILAGDTLRSMADLGLSAIGITLLSETGYITQELSSDNLQVEKYERWDLDQYLDRLTPEVIVRIGDEDLFIRLWQYKITGIHKNEVPIIFLDTNYEKNNAEYRQITKRLYPSNKVYRILQEIVLGIGGFKALEALQLSPSVFHLNEGHSAFLTLEFLDRISKNPTITDPIAFVRNRCVFTTHTPVASGHDVFPRKIVQQYINDAPLLSKIPHAFDDEDNLNMTMLALAMCAKVNGVAKKHAETSNKMFPDYRISAITNGVHHSYWTSPSFHMLFDEFIPAWYEDPFALHGALTIPDYRIYDAHLENKRNLNQYIMDETSILFKKDVITIGYARRITKYKRPDLLFYDLKRLNSIAEKFPMQLVFAGKAHPDDLVGKSMINEILNLKPKLHQNIQLVFLKNYDIRVARYIIPGVDLWLNTPKRPLEASGTSGMKASINGVPNLSVLDGWWIEGHIEGITGWSIGAKPAIYGDNEIVCVDSDDSDDLYYKLDEVILPMFYTNKDEYTKIRKQCIALIGSYFNSHRMVEQYLVNSYLT